MLSYIILEINKFWKELSDENNIDTFKFHIIFRIIANEEIIL